MAIRHRDPDQMLLWMAAAAPIAATCVMLAGVLVAQLLNDTALPRSWLNTLAACAAVGFCEALIPSLWLVALYLIRKIPWVRSRSSPLSKSHPGSLSKS
jgi:hypothetical protein